MMAPLLTLLSVAAAGLAEDEAISSALDTEEALSDDSSELLGEADEVALALLRVTVDMRVDVELLDVDVGLDVLVEDEEELVVVEAALLVLVDSASSSSSDSV